MSAVIVALVLMIGHSALGFPFLPNKVLPCYSNPNSNGSCPYTDITFWLTTRSQPAGIQITADNMRSLPVEAGAPWKFIFHGFTSSKNESPAINLKQAYFAAGEYNLLLADYSAPFMRGQNSLCYPLAATKSLDLVARCSVDFLLSLIEAKVLPADLGLWHLLGHSLGAHTVAGIAHLLQERGVGTVGRITGLDPAGPMFYDRFTSNMRLLGPGDGAFVDVYHTNGGDSVRQYGTNERRGDVDVRFNGGGLQPGCGTDDISCNHQRAVDYFAESIYPQPPDYHQFRGHHPNVNESILVGEFIKRDVTGVIYVTTNAEAPFAQN